MAVTVVNSPDLFPALQYCTLKFCVSVGNTAKLGKGYECAMWKFLVFFQGTDTPSRKKKLSENHHIVQLALSPSPIPSLAVCSMKSWE